jgi:hypothetical protein
MSPENKAQWFAMLDAIEQELLGPPRDPPPSPAS